MDRARVRVRVRVRVRIRFTLTLARAAACVLHRAYVLRSTFTSKRRLRRSSELSSAISSKRSHTLIRGRGSYSGGLWLGIGLG